MRLLILAGVIVALCTVDPVVLSDVKVVRPQSDCQCEEISGSICALHFNSGEWRGRFPNSRNLDKTESIKEFFDFSRLLYLDNYCSHVLYNFLCFHYFPKCDTERPRLGATPCRETCNEVWTACIDHARSLSANFTFPDHLQCSNFPLGSSECSQSTGEVEDCNSQCTACPNATVHLEFATEAGQTAFSSSESVNGSAEVCLRLANVGSYDPEETLDENVTVHLCPTSGSAKAGLDFVAQSNTITFPSDSEKGTVLCTDIEIIRDNENESTEFFKVFASITSPDEAIFGGDIASTTSSISVKIADHYPPQLPLDPSKVPRPDPDPQIPHTECKNQGSCRWRSSVSKNTFVNNFYSYTARVMVLGCRDSVLDVYMIECYNSTDGMCPETPACMKLAICPECSPNPCPVEREVIVAGGTDHGSLFISDYKKKGLFCFRESTSWLKFIPDEWKQ